MTKEEIKKEFEENFTTDYPEGRQLNPGASQKEIWSFFEPYLQFQPKSLEGIEKNIRDIYVSQGESYPSSMIIDKLAKLISQQISQAEERGYKRGYEDGFYIQSYAFIKRSHKSTKGKTKDI